LRRSSTIGAGSRPDTALRLSLYFGNSPEFWMNLQSYYDLKIARRNLKPEDVKRIKAKRAA
jgi:plasmid maintenance system antidote protein VapI